MPLALTNSLLLDLDPPRVAKGVLRIDGGIITAAGSRVRPQPGDEIVDCGGAVVMPGLVNGHAHLYSALAAGMPSPRQAPRNFPEILKRVWWRLDRALDAESVELSAAVGALDALRCGTTTLIDHHASPSCIAGSLDLLERGIDAVGLRAVLCYEVTDRNGRADAIAGLEENRQYVEKRRNAETPKRRNAETPKRRNAETPKRRNAETSKRRNHVAQPPPAVGVETSKPANRDPQTGNVRRRFALPSLCNLRNLRTDPQTGNVGRRFAGMVGAHAAFTLSDASLRACVELAAELDTGLHIHVAEDPGDDRLCREKYGAGLLDRLRRCGLLREGEAPAELDGVAGVAARSILAHGTHLSPDDARRVSAQVSAVAHNPRSNMNNRVGYAPVGWMTNVLLGTDGIGGDMFTEARHAWFKGCDAAACAEPRAPRLRPKPPAVHTPARVLAMLAHSARVAGDLLGCTLGRLTPGAAADIVITDYVPATPLDDANAAAHLIFALGPQHVRHALISGRWVLRDRTPLLLDEAETRRRAAPAARALWRRMQAL